MTKDDRELLAARALRSHLNEAGYPATFAASPPGDFPDFVFTVEVNGRLERWAVEETSLWREAYLNGVAVSDEAIFRPVRRLGQRIEAKAKLPAGLGHGYLFSASGPLEPRVIRAIENEVLRYMETGASNPVMYDVKGQVTTLQEERRVQIHPIDKPGQVVALADVHVSVRGGDGKSWLFDGPSQVEFSLKKRVRSKLIRFSSGLGYARKVLLVTKQFVHAEASGIEDVLQGMGLTDGQVDATLLVTLEEDHFFAGDGTVHFTPAGSAHLVASPGEWVSYPPSFEGWRPRIRRLV